MTRIVDIGVSSAKDFQAKIVLPNLNEFRREGSLINLVNSAYALWHMTEWLFYELVTHGRCSDTPSAWKVYKTKVIKACPEIKLVRDVAESCKHRKLDRADVIVDRTFVYLYFPMGDMMSSLAGMAFDYVLEHNGQRELARDVFGRVSAYWKAEIAKLP